VAVLDVVVVVVVVEGKAMEFEVDEGVEEDGRGDEIEEGVGGDIAAGGDGVVVEEAREEEKEEGDGVTDKKLGGGRLSGIGTDKSIIVGT